VGRYAKNAADIAALGASFIALIDSKLGEVCQRPNSEEVKAAVKNEMAAYEDLNRIEVFVERHPSFLRRPSRSLWLTQQPLLARASAMGGSGSTCRFVIRGFQMDLFWGGRGDVLSCLGPQPASRPDSGRDAGPKSVVEAAPSAGAALFQWMGTGIFILR
jgi:hypothetical protein